MKKVFNFIISCISLQLIHCNGSFLTLIHEKSDKKKSQVNNWNIYNTIEAKIFCLIAIKLKTKDLLTKWNSVYIVTYRNHIFFKIGVLQNFAIFAGKLFAGVTF